MEKIISLIRFHTAVVIGFALTWLMEATGITVDEETSNQLVQAFQVITTCGFYLLIRVASAYFPWLEYVFLIPSEPQYKIPRMMKKN